jgi:thioredoxin-related protein
MLRFKGYIVVLLIGLAFTATAQGSLFDRWYPYDQATQLAKQHHRPLMVYFWGHGCPYCDQMNTFVLSDQSVAGLLERHFVVASVDSQSSQGRSLAAQMRAFGVPIYVFFVPGNTPGTWQEVGRVFGSRPKGLFLQELRQVCTKTGGGDCE